MKMLSSRPEVKPAGELDIETLKQRLSYFTRNYLLGATHEEARLSFNALMHGAGVYDFTQAEFTCDENANETIQLAVKLTMDTAFQAIYLNMPQGYTDEQVVAMNEQADLEIEESMAFKPDFYKLSIEDLAHMGIAGTVTALVGGSDQRPDFEVKKTSGPDFSVKQLALDLVNTDPMCVPGGGEYKFKYSDALTARIESEEVPKWTAVDCQNGITGYYYAPYIPQLK